MPRSLARLPTRFSVNTRNDSISHTQRDSDGESDTNSDDSDAFKRRTNSGGTNGTPRSNRALRRRVSMRLPPANAASTPASASKRGSLSASTSQPDASSASSSPRQPRMPSHAGSPSVSSSRLQGASSGSPTVNAKVKPEHNTRVLDVRPEETSPGPTTSSFVPSDISSSGLSSPAVASSHSTPTPSPPRPSSVNCARQPLQAVSPSTFFSTSSTTSLTAQATCVSQAASEGDIKHRSLTGRPQSESITLDEAGTHNGKPPNITRLRHGTTAAALVAGETSDSSSDLSDPSDISDIEDPDDDVLHNRPSLAVQHGQTSKKGARRDVSKSQEGPAAKGLQESLRKRRATMAAPTHQLPRPLSATRQSRKSTAGFAQALSSPATTTEASASATASPAPSDSPFPTAAGTPSDTGDGVAGAARLKRKTASRVPHDAKAYNTAGLYDSDWHRDSIRWDMKKKGIGKLRRAATASSTAARSNSPLPELPFLPEPIFGGTEILAGRRDFKLPRSLVNEQENLRARVDAKRKPPQYQHISKNRYVSRPKLQNAEIQVCSCSPTSGCGDNCLNRRMEYICNPKSCPCGEQCTNISLAKRPHARCDVQWYGKRGFGLVTRDPIAKDGLVDEYRGEVISMAEAIRRTNEMYKDTGNFYFLDYDAPAGEVLDGGLRGNVTRFANHSCNPNCYIQKWILCGDGSQCSSEFQIGLFALRDIAAGEELTYDYGWSAFKSRTVAEEAVKRTPEACYCGADNCLGVLGGRRVANKVNPPLAPATVAENRSLLGKRARNGQKPKTASAIATAKNSSASSETTLAKKGRNSSSTKASASGRYRLPLPRVSATPEPSNKPRYTNLGSRKAAMAFAARRCALPRPLSPESAAVLMMKASNGELDGSAVDASWLDLPAIGEDSSEEGEREVEAATGSSHAIRPTKDNSRIRSRRSAVSNDGPRASSAYAENLDYYRTIYTEAELEVKRQGIGKAAEAGGARGSKTNSERNSTGTMTMAILNRAARRIGLGAASASALAQFCRRGTETTQSAEPVSSRTSGTGPSPSTAPKKSTSKSSQTKASKPKPRARPKAVSVVSRKQKRLPRPAVLPTRTHSNLYLTMPSSPPPPGLKRKSTVKLVLEAATVNGSSQSGGSPGAAGSKRKIIYTSPKDIPAGITDPSGGFIPDLPSNLVDMGIMTKGDARRARNAYLARVRRFVKRGATEAEALELAAKMRSKGDENTPLFRAKLAATAAGVSPASLGVGNEEAAQHASFLASSGVTSAQLGAAMSGTRDATRDSA